MKMRVVDFYGKMCELIPTSLSCEWDKDGFEACPEPEREVRRVLIALDATPEVIDRACAENFDVIVTHHPVFFGGLGNINALNPMGNKAVKLARSGVALMSFHTRLDALDGGVNDTLAALVGLKDVIAVGDDHIARVGELEDEMSAEEFATVVKEVLSCGDGEGAAQVLLSGAGRPVKRVALVGGSGGGELGLALSAGADTFLTGDMKYHELLSSTENNINLVAAGHFFTEYPVCHVLKEKIGEISSDIEAEVFFSNRIIEI